MKLKISSLVLATVLLGGAIPANAQQGADEAQAKAMAICSGYSAGGSEASATQEDKDKVNKTAEAFRMAAIYYMPGVGAVDSTNKVDAIIKRAHDGMDDESDETFNANMATCSTPEMHAKVQAALDDLSKDYTQMPVQNQK